MQQRQASNRRRRKRLRSLAAQAKRNYLALSSDEPARRVGMMEADYMALVNAAQRVANDSAALIAHIRNLEDEAEKAKASNG